jgi:hypothetical protein
MYIPVFIPNPASAWPYYYQNTISILNNTLIIGVLAVALFKIKKLISDVPSAA